MSEPGRMTMDKAPGAFNDKRGPLMRFIDDELDSSYNLTTECRALVPMILTLAGYLDYVYGVDTSTAQCFEAAMAGIWIPAPDYVFLEQEPHAETDDLIKDLMRKGLKRVRAYVLMTSERVNDLHHPKAVDLLAYVDLFIGKFMKGDSMTARYVAGS